MEGERERPTGEGGKSASPPEGSGGEALEKVRAALNHDLRTPLTVIISYAQTLAQGRVGELDERQREMLEVIVRECYRMDQLIKELVELMREALAGGEG
jgi:signal transduction histidine kinase